MSVFASAIQCIQLQKRKVHTGRAECQMRIYPPGAGDCRLPRVEQQRGQAKRDANPSAVSTRVYLCGVPDIRHASSLLAVRTDDF